MFALLVTCRRRQTQHVNGGANPDFHEAFVVPCQGLRDAVVLGIYLGEGGQSLPIGMADIFRLDLLMLTAISRVADGGMTCDVFVLLMP